MKVSEERRKAYQATYDDWLKKLGELHEVFLDGARIPAGDQFKGLLNRESRAFEKYQQARLELLGIPRPADNPFGD